MTAAFDFATDCLEPGGSRKNTPTQDFPAFRVGGEKFASLASQAQEYGNLMLTLEQQASFVEEAPEIFLPIPSGWERARTHAYSPGGERGCDDGCTPNGVETANG